VVDKIDKTEPKSVYFIDSAPESADDRGKKNQQQKDGDEYSGSHAAPGWQKVYASAMNRRYLKLRRENIARVWFQRTTMQRGISLAEIHIETKDSRIIKNAHIVLSQREDFWTLKKYQAGQEMPLALIIKQPVIEISVPMPSQQTGDEPPAGALRAAAKPLGINSIGMIILAIVSLAILALLIFVIVK